ncbi:MAG TPA: glycosyltransferase [Usitatibacter sp.]|nr:glycosyltransferase [Usitatibacter sp.]
MKVLFAYNEHRGGGGSNNATRATMEALGAAGIEIETFRRSSRDLPTNGWGRLRAGTSAFHAPESLRAFERQLEAFRPDVVHAYELFPLISPRILGACTRRGVPVVMSTDDFRLTCPVRTHLRDGRVCTECLDGREYRAVLHNCRGNMAESIVLAGYAAMVRKLGLFSDHVTTFIAPSRFTCDWLVDKARIPRERIAVLAPVVDLPAEASDPANGTYVGFAGRIVPEKGIRTFAEAARISGLPFRLSRHESYFDAPELSQGLETVVTHDRSGLEAFYRGARMIVLPSLWFETFGLAAAEAMSHGIPAIGSRMGAIVELIEDGVDGFLFEPGDAQDLAAKVTRLWSDPGLSRRMGAAARIKAAQWQRASHVENVRAIYEKAVADRMGGQAR